METSLTADQEFFVETTRKFLAAETPVGSGRARELEDETFSRAWWSRAAELGWTSFLVSETDGGGSLSGAGLRDLVLVAEEMGRVVAPGPLVPVSVAAIALAGSEPPGHRALLGSIVSGEAVVAWAHYEDGGSWGPDGIALRAEPDGDGFVLTGTKSLVEAANQADHLLVSARTEVGLVQLLVPPTAGGVTITLHPVLDLSRRYAAVTFDGVRVPGSAVVGRPDPSGRAIEHQLQVAVALQVAELAGMVAQVLAVTREYLGDRYSFGRPLDSYQALKHRVADLTMWVEACLGAASAAARAVQEESPDAATVVSAAKAYIGEKATDVIQDCIQLHGGIGITWEHDLHLYLRRAMADRFTFGPPDEHRTRLAAMAGLA